MSMWPDHRWQGVGKRERVAGLPGPPIRAERHPGPLGQRRGRGAVLLRPRSGAPRPAGPPWAPDIRPGSAGDVAVRRSPDRRRAARRLGRTPGQPTMPAIRAIARTIRPWRPKWSGPVVDDRWTPSGRVTDGHQPGSGEPA
jgi:hypothetical protein